MTEMTVTGKREFDGMYEQVQTVVFERVASYVDRRMGSEASGGAEPVDSECCRHGESGFQCILHAQYASP